MPDFVDLVSSENESPAKSIHSSKNYATKPLPAPVKPANPLAPVRQIRPKFDLSLDNDDDFSWPQQTKKRKLDSSAAQPGPSAMRPWDAVQVVTLKDSQNVVAHAPIRRPSRGTSIDEIEFTSPVHGDMQKTIWTTMGSQDELSEESPRPKKKSTLSSTTAALLEEITANGPKRPRSDKAKGKAKAKAKAEDVSGNEERSIALVKPKKAKPRSAAGDQDQGTDRAAKALLKERQKEDKEARKEAEILAKEEARSQKRTEKQRAADLASVNRSKMDKNTTTPEMLVDFPASMNGLSCLNQAQEFLKKASCKTSIYESTVPGLIKFRRRILADWDETAGHWHRVAERIDDEKMVIVYLPAYEFARLVSPIGSQDETYESQLVRVKSLHSGYRIIYLIEGLEKLITKEKSAQTRSYQAAVRRAAQAATAAEQQQPENPAQPARKKQSNVIVDEPAIEAALLKMQIHHKTQIHQTISPLDTGETILAMTQQLSQSRYKDPPNLAPAKMAEQPNFCMASGQVPTGKTLEETYLQILQRVIRVTEREATAIAKTYPNIASLYDAFSTKGGRVLQDIMKAGGGAKGPADGTVAAERRIGPQTSERFGRILLGEDATALLN